MTRKRPLMFGAVFMLLWLKEIFVALDNGESIVLHLLTFAGFYLGVTLVIFLFRKWSYSFLQLFTIGGLWGVLIEQDFAAAQMLLSGQLFDFLFFAGFIFSVYGFYLGGPFLLFPDAFGNGKRPSFWKSLTYFAAFVTIPLATWSLWGALLG